MTAPEFFQPGLYVYLRLPLGPSPEQSPMLGLRLFEGDPAHPRPPHLHPIAESGDEGTDESFVTSDGSDLMAAVALFYLVFTPEGVHLEYVMDFLPCQAPVRLALGAARAPVIASTPFPGPAHTLLRGSLVIPLSGPSPLNSLLALLWPTSSTADLRALHVEPGGLYVEGVLPPAFHPAPPAREGEPVVLRVPQDAALDTIEGEPIWTLGTAPVRGVSGRLVTPREYVRAVAAQLEAFGAGSRSFLRQITADPPEDAAVRIAATPHPFKGGTPTRLRWWIDRPGVRMVIGAGASGSAAFEPEALHGTVTRRSPADSWRRSLDFRFSRSPAEPAGRRVGFQVTKRSGAALEVRLDLDETLVPEQLSHTAPPAGLGGPEAPVRSWLCTASGWLAIDALPAAGAARLESTPSAALAGLVDVTGIANGLAGPQAIADLEIRAQALSGSDVAVGYRRGGGVESLSFTVSEPMTTVTTGPYWAADPGPSPRAIPRLWAGEPDDAGVARKLVPAQFVTAPAQDPSPGEGRLVVRLTAGPSSSVVSFRLTAARLTAWHLPEGLPLVQTLPAPGAEVSSDSLDEGRGLVPFVRSQPTTEVCFSSGGLPVLSDWPRLSPPVGVGAGADTGPWVITGAEGPDRYFLSTLPGVELRLPRATAPQWVYRHATPALDEHYSEMLRGLPPLAAGGAPAEVGWDASAVGMAAAFPLLAGSAPVPAVGWLPPAAARDTLVDPSGGCRVRIDQAATDLRGHAPALAFVVADEAGREAPVRFQHPTSTEPELPVAFTHPLIHALVPRSGRLPTFAVGLHPDPGADVPGIVRNGQPLLAGRLVDESVVTADGLGVVRAEPSGALARSATPGDTDDERRWTETLGLLADATAGDVLTVELVSMPLSGGGAPQGAAWMCHDGAGGWPTLRGFPLFPLQVTVKGTAAGPSMVVVKAVWMRAPPAPGTATPPGDSRNVVHLRFTRRRGRWELSVAGWLDWQFQGPPNRGTLTGTTLARIELQVAGSPPAQGPWRLAVAELSLDHPVGLIRLPAAGCTAELTPGRLTIWAHDPAGDGPFSYDIEAVSVGRELPPGGVVPIDAGLLRWRSSAEEEVHWELCHTLGPISFGELPADRLRAVAAALRAEPSHDTIPALKAISRMLTPEERAFGTAPAPLLDRLASDPNLYRPGVWDEERLDRVTRARIAGRATLSPEGIRHLGAALLAAALPDLPLPPAWRFTVTAGHADRALVDLRADLRRFGPNRFALVPGPTTAAPPNLPGSWFKRSDATERGFLVVDFAVPARIRDLGAEFWMALTDASDVVPNPTELDRSRLAARLIVASRWTGTPSAGRYRTAWKMELTGRWVLVNQRRYTVPHAPPVSVLAVRTRVYLNRAVAPAAAVLAGVGPRDADAFLFGVAEYIVADLRRDGAEWTWQTPQTLRLTTLERYLRPPHPGPDADALVADGGIVLWLARFGTGDTPWSPPRAPPGQAAPGAPPDLSAAGMDLRLGPSRPEPFDTSGGHEVRFPWAAGPALADHEEAPAIVLAPEPPRRAYPLAGAHPRGALPRGAAPQDRVDDVPRGPGADWLDGAYLAQVLWPLKGPPPDHPAAPLLGGPYTDLAWLLGSEPGELAAATVIRRHDPNQAGGITGGRTLVGFPFHLAATVTPAAPPALPDVSLQLLVYDRGRFRRAAAARGVAGPAAARAWGMAELVRRRIRTAALVISDHSLAIALPSPLGAVDEPLSGARPWQAEPDPGATPPDPARHLPGAALTLSPETTAALLTYHAEPIAGRPPAAVPSATLWRLACLNDGEGTLPGHLRPAMGSALPGNGASTVWVSRLDPIAFTATERGYPDAGQDLNHPRPAVVPLRSGDAQVLVPPQIDVTTWSPRPGELVASQWGVTRYQRRDDRVSVGAGHAPAIALRRPRAAAGVNESAGLTLLGAARALAGGRLSAASWQLALTLTRSARPADDGAIAVLAMKRSVHPGLRTPADAAVSPVVVPAEGTSVPGVQLFVLAGPGFTPQREAGGAVVRRSFLLRVSPPDQLPPEKISGPLDAGLAGLGCAELTTGPSDGSLWAPVGGGVSRFTGEIPPLRPDPALPSVTFGLFAYERDPLAPAELWRRVDLPGGNLALFFVFPRDVVSDVPLTVSVVAHPRSSPAQARLIGTGRLDPEGLTAAQPTADASGISWRSTSRVQAVYRSFARAGEELVFGVRVSGPGGEAIPYEEWPNGKPGPANHGTGSANRRTGATNRATARRPARRARRTARRARRIAELTR